MATDRVDGTGRAVPGPALGLLVVLGIVAVTAAPVAGAEQRRPKYDYLKIVRDYADAMIADGRDVYGNVRSPLFAEALDGRTMWMIEGDVLSPDWVGTAREHLEEVIGGAPAMFVQGFCGDVNCYHIFGTPAQARPTGARLGEAAARAMATLRCEMNMLESVCSRLISRNSLSAKVLSAWISSCSATLSSRGNCSMRSTSPGP